LVFVWDGTPSSTRKEVFLRIFPADGSPPGDPVQVNTYTDRAQHGPRVAINTDDSFLVVWQSDEKPNPEDGFYREVVRSQAFDANANPVEDEQLLTELKPLIATGGPNPEVAVLNDGSYIVVWRSSQSSDPLEKSTSIQARKIGANGIPLGGQFPVNEPSSDGEDYPAVTALADGGFLVVWTVPKQVRGRRFAADGTPAGGVVQLNTLVEGSKSQTKVVSHQDGGVLVVWRDTAGVDNDVAEIYGRFFNQGLNAQGNEFRINVMTIGQQHEPEVADYGQGGFFVVWVSAVSAGNDIEPSSIEGRIVTGSNQFAGPQFLVNSWTDSTQQFPGMGGNNGRIAIAWKSGSNADTSGNVIMGQFWSICGIFCDGFE